MKEEQKMAKTEALCIEGEMTIYRAMELKEFLFPAARKVNISALDLSAVTEIDTAGVQLLLLAQHAAIGAGQPFEIRSPSAAALEVLTLLGLDQMCAQAEVVQ